MKKIILIYSFASLLLFTSCDKNELVIDTVQKDVVENFELQLSQDYSQAGLYHSFLTLTSSTTTSTTTATNSDSVDHASHHIVGLNKATMDDVNFNKRMFTKNDSSFSEHYFQYCTYLLKNGIMNIDSTQMMGHKTTSMGTGNMMDKLTMMASMDSMHVTLQNSTNPDYMKSDSMMHDHMVMCKIMSTQTDSVESIYNMMLLLRRSHKLNF